MKLSKISLFCFFLAFFMGISASAHPVLTPTGDCGDGYLNQMVFFGESTTTHLRSRSEISPEQVWANKSGTMKLDAALLSRPLTHPRTDEQLTLSGLVELEHPAILVCSFGLNGITGFVRNKDSYLGNYRKLIRAVHNASPNTRIILQTVYPVAEEAYQTDWNFSVPPACINDCILTLNTWLAELCEDDPLVRCADTASVLRDANGFLRPDFTTDGIHLTHTAYAEILMYLRTHAWIE